MATPSHSGYGPSLRPAAGTVELVERDRRVVDHFDLGKNAGRKSLLFRLAERRRRKARLYVWARADDAAGCHTLTVLLSYALRGARILLYR